jgi:hypothetical protein
MLIKFTCPHCKRPMNVNESLAGKKGRCKACQQILTVPNPALAKPQAEGQSVAAAPKVETPAPPPPPPPADVEAEAAALFADEPKTEEPVETESIDLNCPYCDEPIHFPVDLAGKRAQCPECKHIIKVPDLVKKEPKDWRKTETRGPAGARLPDQPAPEGAWGSATAGKVDQKSLEQAGVIPTVKPPRTPWQRVRWLAAAAAAVFLLTGLSWGGYRWWLQQSIDRAVKEALDYAASQEAAREVGPIGQAALYFGAGDLYLHSDAERRGVKARDQFGKAFTTYLQTARSSDERDLILTDLAVAQVELGGQAHTPETDAEVQIPWEDGGIHKLLIATLTQIGNLEARREAVRAVGQRLIARGENQRALSLANQVFPKPSDEKAAALSIVGLELLKADDRTTAERALMDALDLYKEKAPNGKGKKEKPLPLRAEVAALCLLLEKQLPKLGKDPEKEDKANERIGQIVWLARNQRWDEARQKAAAFGPDEQGRFRALFALADAAVDSKAANASGDVENALISAEKLGKKPELSRSILHLTELALAAGLSEERVQTLADGIANPALRGRAQLAVLRVRLAKTQQPVEKDVADKIEPRSLAHLLAMEELARHNASLSTSWTDKVKSWPQPSKAFGLLGAARGMQTGK